MKHRQLNVLEKSREKIPEMHSNAVECQGLFKVGRNLSKWTESYTKTHKTGT